MLYPKTLTCVVEGPLDQVAVRRLANDTGLQLGQIHVKKGRDQIESHLGGYNNAARQNPWLVLVDLDRDECAPSLYRRWLPDPAQLMHFRVAIHSIEAWLLADQERIAEFMDIEPALVPPLPEKDSHPSGPS